MVKSIQIPHLDQLILMARSGNGPENATTGISIIGWTGNAVDNTVIPHGLGADADVVITKRRSGNSDWLVLHSAIATDTANVLRLNATQQALNGSSSLTNGCPDEFTQWVSKWCVALAQA